MQIERRFKVKLAEVLFTILTAVGSFVLGPSELTIWAYDLLYITMRFFSRPTDRSTVCAWQTKAECYAFVHSIYLRLITVDRVRITHVVCVALE